MPRACASRSTRRRSAASCASTPDDAAPGRLGSPDLLEWLVASLDGVESVEILALVSASPFRSRARHDDTEYCPSLASMRMLVGFGL
jgi:hypothetical protein